MNDKCKLYYSNEYNRKKKAKKKQKKNDCYKAVKYEILFIWSNKLRKMIQNPRVRVEFI